MDDDGRPLTDHEAALVFRRASEIDVDLLQRTDGWRVDQLEAVGMQAGISAEAVRRAVVEVRLGASSADVDGPAVGCSRIVPGPPAEVQRELGMWLREQLFEPVRDRAGLAVYDRRRDDDAVRRRARDAAGRFRLSAVRRVAVNVAALPGAGTAVRVAAALAVSRIRRTTRFALLATPPVWLSAAATAGVSDALGMDEVVLGTPVVVAGCAYLGWRNAARLEAADRAAVALALDGALDRLERF